MESQAVEGMVSKSIVEEKDRVVGVTVEIGSDVFVVCDRDKITRKGIYGAPDFVVEVLSKSTKKKDMYIKLMKYMNAGVKEYWMVDPEKKIVLVHDFQNDNDVKIYGFDAGIPVGIFEGDCQIDFREIDEYVSFLYEK